MTPTPRLRFVEREMRIKSDDGFLTFHQSIPVLQQWWEQTEWNSEGEWRDVPVEKEE